MMAEHNISIRKALESDTATLAEITDAAYARYIPLIGRKPLPMTADHRKLIVENDAWLILCDDTPAGLLELITEPDCVLIYSVAIRPEYQSQGLGRRLLEWAEQETWRIGLRRIRLYTNAVMESNLALYRRLGYQETRRETIQGSTRVDMSKDLNQAHSPQATQLVLAFNEALNARDLDGMMRLLTEDTVFENTYPPPDGERFAGQEAVRGFWQEFFQGSGAARIEPEEIFAAGERVVMRWVYRWTDREGDEGHIRGVDVYILRDGLIAEKLSYVKG
jgi:GNAT superfamily N-acetyltransferase/ketosteroid isomerase-like protein